MRTLNRNMRKMFYSLQLGEQPIYKMDEAGNIQYTDVNGVQVPIEEGSEMAYSYPVPLKASLKMGGGKAEAEAYGVSVSDYDAVLLVSNSDVKLAEGTLLWHTKPIRYEDTRHSKVDETSAEYTVVKPLISLNYNRYIIKRRV